MNFSKYAILLLLFTVSLFNIRCKENNPIENDFRAGKRDFVWSIDSVDYGSIPGSIELTSIWGSAPDDIWGASYSSDVRDCLWHYDGKVWSRATENTPLTTPGLGSREVGHLWGTAKNDIWAIGGRIYGSGQSPDPFVMHYDGKWQEIPMNSSMPVGSRDILGIGKDDFWVAGVGMLTHYKNGSWKKYFVSDSITIISKIGLIAGTIYGTAYQVGYNSLYLLRFVNDRFVTIDTTDVYNGTYGHSGLLQIGNKVYSVGINRIASADITNSGIDVHSWKKEISMNGGFRDSFIYDQNNIWAGGFPNCLYNFNGINWQGIKISIPNKYVPADCGFNGLWTNGNEIIVCDNDHGKIYHGR